MPKLGEPDPFAQRLGRSEQAGRDVKLAGVDCDDGQTPQASGDTHFLAVFLAKRKTLSVVRGRLVNMTAVQSDLAEIRERIGGAVSLTHDAELRQGFCKQRSSRLSVALFVTHDPERVEGKADEWVSPRARNRPSASDKRAVA